MKRWIRQTIMVFMAFAMTAGVSLGVASPVQADSYPYNTHCKPIPGFNTGYAYGSGSQAVYASGWYNYGAARAWSPCLDINVVTTIGNTATVRVVFCPSATGPQFSCYADLWGTITGQSQPTGCYCGVASPRQHFPSGNYDWLFRVESLGSSEFFGMYL